MGSKRQMTAAKMAREREVREKRLRKQERRAERKRAAAEAAALGEAGMQVEAGVEGSALADDADDGAAEAGVREAPAAPEARASA